MMQEKTFIREKDADEFIKDLSGFGTKYMVPQYIKSSYVDNTHFIHHSYRATWMVLYWSY